MQEVDDEGGYSDDDLDALPVDTFHELQQNALRSTQLPNIYEEKTVPPGTANVPPVPIGPRLDYRHQAAGGHAPRNAPSNLHPQQPSSDYGDFDDEMLDGEIFDAAEESAPIRGPERTVVGRPYREITHGEQRRQQQFGAPPQLHNYEVNQAWSKGQVTSSLQLEQVAQRGDYQHQEQDVAAHQGAPEPTALSAQGSAVVEELQAQIQKVFP